MEKAINPNLAEWIENFELYVDGNPLAIKNISTVVGNLISNPHSDFYDSTKYYAWLLMRILCSNTSYKCLQGLAYSGFLYRFIPSMINSYKLSQNKKFGKNLLEHSLLTVVAMDAIPEEIIGIVRKYCDYDPVPPIVLSCLMHDVGKLFDIDIHESVGATIAAETGDLLGSYVGQDYLGDRIYNIVDNHMRPFGFQRGEKWGEEAIEKFIHDSDGIGIALMTICVSIADKFASTRNFIYIEKLVELFYLCEKAYESNKDL